jgi:hypothetical protein
MTQADGLGAIRMPARLRFVATAVGSLFLASCATFSPDGGFETADRMAKERLGREAKWLRKPSEESAAREQVKTLLAKPLTVDDAVQVALLTTIAAAYAEPSSRRSGAGWPNRPRLRLPQRSRR